MNAREYLRKTYARRLTPDEDGGFTATIQEFPGCIAEGDNAETALKNLERVAESWIEAALGLGQAIPDPIELHGYSGKIALRLPRGLHKQAAELSASEGTSINQLLTAAIANYLGGKAAFGKLASEFARCAYPQNISVNMLIVPNIALDKSRLDQAVTGAQVVQPGQLGQAGMLPFVMRSTAGAPNG